MRVHCTTCYVHAHTLILVHTCKWLALMYKPKSLFITWTDFLLRTIVFFFLLLLFPSHSFPKTDHIKSWHADSENFMLYLSYLRFSPPSLPFVLPINRNNNNNNRTTIWRRSKTMKQDLSIVRVHLNIIKWDYKYRVCSLYYAECRTTCIFSLHDSLFIWIGFPISNNTLRVEYI